MTQSPESNAEKTPIFSRRNPWLWIVVFGFAFTTVISLGLRPFMRRIPEPPPVIHTLPEFDLIDHQGRPFNRASLAGDVWVFDFFFTSCPSICADLTRRMAQLQEAFEREGVDARLVSVSVDPENDTPEVLRQYAKKHGADLDRWVFVTGSEEAVRSLLVDGFHTHLGDRKEISPNVFDIAHASYFVLVDGDGGVRRHYRALDEEELSRAFHESRTLLRSLAQTE